jgi:hypothetical protein
MSPPRHKPGLADLRPNATIRCLYCDQDKPQGGATKFHAHHVCADCTRKLQTRENTRP